MFSDFEAYHEQIGPIPSTKESPIHHGYIEPLATHLSDHRGNRIGLDRKLAHADVRKNFLPVHTKLVVAQV